MNTKKIRAWAKGFCAKVLILLLVGLAIPTPAFAAIGDQWSIGANDQFKLDSSGNIHLTPTSTITITGAMSLVGAFSPSSITVSGNIVGNGNWTVGSDSSDTVTWNAYVPGASSVKLGTAAAGGTIGWSIGNARIENTGNSYVTGTFGTSGLATLASAAVTGAANLNGAVALGDSTADTITLPGVIPAGSTIKFATGTPTISWSSTNSRFDFVGAVRVQGNLSSTGIVSGDEASFTNGVGAGSFTATGTVAGAAGAYTNTVTAGAFSTGGTIVATGAIQGASIQTTGNGSIGGNLIVDDNVTLGENTSDSITWNAVLPPGESIKFGIAGLATVLWNGTAGRIEVNQDFNTAGANSAASYTASGAVSGASASFTNTAVAGAFTTGGVVTATGQVTGGTLSTPGNVLADGAVIGDEASFTNAVGAGSFVATGNVLGAGGFLQTYAFYRGAIGDNLTDSPAEAVGTASGSGMVYTLPVSGSITRLAVALSAAITTGTMNFEVTKNGAGIGLNVDVSVGSQYVYVTQAIGADAFVAGDRLGIFIDNTNPGTESLNAIITVTTETGNN